MLSRIMCWFIVLFFFQAILYGSNDRTIIIDHGGTTYTYDYNTNTYETKTSTSTYHGDSGSGAYDSESGKSIFVGFSPGEDLKISVFIEFYRF